MALVRSKIELQHAWRAWADQRAVDDSLSAVDAGDMKLELAREMTWMQWSFDLENDLIGRLAKYDDLIATFDGDLSSFDPWWVQRRAFLVWAQT